MTREESAFQQLGGEPVLRSLIRQFVGRVFSDSMIGFFFRNAHRERIEQLEYEHAAEHLGAGQPYTGRPLRAAHSKHRIAGGQFDRRLVLLEQVLTDAGVEPSIRRQWLNHAESLRDQITADAGGRCSLGTPAVETDPVSFRRLPTETKGPSSR